MRSVSYVAEIYLFIIMVVFAAPFSILSAQSEGQLSAVEFRYFPGTSEPDSGWNTLPYNDSSWSEGRRSIGYGDGDDTVLVDTISSVYFRKTFQVTNKYSISDLVMQIDFDDGFVAYINGKEFARVNMGVCFSPTSYNQLAERSHEAEKYRDPRSPVLGYRVADSIVENYLEEGTNILAIEVHNDSLSGSDLSLEADIYSLNWYNMYDWRCRYKQSVQLDSSHLPILVIESIEQGIPVKRIEVGATLKVINNSNGFNKPGDEATDYTGPISIEVRGESSADFPKRSYDFELQDVFENDTNVSLLGLPAENDWILQGPFADKSQIRNALIYSLGRKLGGWHPRVKFCELVLNGEYLGLYTLVEKIKRDNNRIDIARLNPDEISGNDLSGGYICKWDKGSSQFQIAYPKKKNIQDEQEDYIRDYYKLYLSALLTNSGFDPEQGYQKYLNRSSLIDNIIISELGKNCDAYLYSTYFFKDRDDRDPRLYIGPLWDFDLCFGNASWQDGHLTNKWQFEYYSNNRFELRRLLEDESLVDALEDRWMNLRKGSLSNDSIDYEINALVSYLQEAIDRNYQVWPLIKKPLFTNEYSVNNYTEEIDHIKSWIDTRTKWIDDNVGDIYYPVTQYPSEVDELSIATSAISKVYPNPFTKSISIDFEGGMTEVYSFYLVALDGKSYKLSEEYNGRYSQGIITLDVPENLGNGLYLLELWKDGKPYEYYKVIKNNSDH